MMDFNLEFLSKKLDLSGKDNFTLYDPNNLKIKNLPSRLQQSLSAIKPNACFFINQIPSILFFEVENFNDFVNIHKKAWNFNLAPIFIIISKNQIRIHNAFIFDKDNTKSQNESLLEDILNIDSDIDDKLNKYNYMNITSGKYWSDHKDKFENNKKKVDTLLLNNINEARKILVLELNLNESLTNTLIGRLLFVRYLIDRKVELDSNFIDVENSKADFISLLNNKDKLYEFFSYLKKEFNGDMFPLTKDESTLINDNHLSVLYHLFNGSTLKYKRYIQLSLFDIYDFEIIPIELISNIYETFIGKKASNDENTFSTTQKDNKSFYTPPYLVDYVLSNTVSKKLATSPQCKILDPSCGSGIFLVESLRKIISRNIDELITKDGFNKEFLKELVTSNIFGIDIDANALDIAKFSVYITMLDYMNPKDIKGFKFPSLKDNFFHNDFFKLPKKIENYLKDQKFDFIIGNPPWGNTSKISEEYVTYSEKQKIPLNRKQIAQAFLFRVEDFSSENTRIALIVTSKIFYNVGNNAVKFREKFLSTFIIEEIFDLTAVRNDIFLMANNPASIVFYHKNKKGLDNIKNNILNFIAPKPNILFRLLKIIVVESKDIKEILQKKFIKKFGGDDWLWKTILYGIVYDSLFIKRLKNDFQYTINTYPELEKPNVGFQIGGEERDLKSTEDIKEFKYININKNQQILLENFYVNIDEAMTFKDAIGETYIHRPRDKSIYEGPHVLLKKGTNGEFQLEAAYCSENVVFTDGITSIRSKTKNPIILKNIVALLNSDLFKYYFLTTGSSAGVERGQGHNANERFTFPMPSKLSNSLAEIVDKISGLVKNNIISNMNPQIEEEMQQLNQKVFELYNVTSSELKLIDYMKKVTLPMITNDQSYLRVPTKNELKAYITIFFKAFDFLLKKSDKGISAEVYSTKWSICINFIVSSKKNSKQIIYNDSNNVTYILNKLSNYSLKKQTEKIVFQRDIKGFQEDSFFILKPAEFKSWHEVIAKHDSDEIVEAIMAGANNDR